MNKPLNFATLNVTFDCIYYEKNDVPTHFGNFMVLVPYICSKLPIKHECLMVSLYYIKKILVIYVCVRWH